MRRRRLRIVASAIWTFALFATVLVTQVQAERNESRTTLGGDLQRRISVGGLHTCAILDNGHIQCWGGNLNGQLGNGTTSATTIPLEVSGISTALEISAGATHTCALIHDGTVKCWGNNGNGQLGDNSTGDATTHNSLVPVSVVGIADAEAIAVGGFHSCALLVGGTMKCWGHNGSGQLGTGTTGTSLEPVVVKWDHDSDATTPLVTLTGISAITAGEFHTCALLNNGSIKCWGNNGFGQLGNGNTTTKHNPVEVSGIPDGEHEAEAIAAGSSHTCAVLDDGTARCWGLNEYGQLGDNSDTDRNTPVTVVIDTDPSPFVTDLETLSGITAITAGQYHSCVRRTGGLARCWGNNWRGQVGDGTVQKSPEDDPLGLTKRYTPVPVNGLGGTAAAITAGGFHTCALLDGGVMKCWGYNFYGQLGSYQNQSLVPVVVTALQGAETVSVGTEHACAILEDDRTVCWGNNTNGELGADSSAGNSIIPVFVKGPGGTALSTSLISAGNGHVCALPVGSSTPKCWGRNLNGQLGNGTFVGTDEPVTVSSLSNATLLSAHGALGTDERGHTCARTSSSLAKCFGRNVDGQLGDGTGTDRNTPVTVQFDTDPDPATTTLGDLTGVSGVAAGGFHSCGWLNDADKSAWCWGFNGAGQLGDNTTTSKSYAVRVKLVDNPDPDPDVYLTNVVAMTAGVGHTCALLGDGKVRCWGENGEGQLGDGTNVDHHMPVVAKYDSDPGPGVVPADLAGVTRIIAGDNHTCALLQNTSMRCWGRGDEGQLGNGSTSDSPLAIAPSGLGDPPSEVTTLVISIGAGRKNSCAVLLDTAVYCWGSNLRGQLGDGIGPLSPTPRTVLNLPGSVGNNKLPVPADDTATTAPGVPVTIGVLANDTDADVPAQTLEVTGVSTPSKGSASFTSTSVTYTPNSNFCDTLTDFTDSFEYLVTDNYAIIPLAEVPARVTITVTCPNSPPDAVNDNVSTSEDTPVGFNVLANDSDPNLNPISVSSNTAPGTGTVGTVAANGDATYTPNANFCGSDSFTYTITDGLGGSDSATVNLTVDCVNDPPVAGDDLVGTSEDTAVTINVGANDSDVDSPSFAISSISLPSNGAAASTGPTSIKYAPDSNFCGSDIFNYTISDGEGGTDSAEVTVNVSCVNDGPNANDDAASTIEDTPVVINVLVNDIDPEGDALTVTAVSDPPHGAAAISGGGTTVTYSPDQDFCGVDGFTYSASDGSGESDTGQVVPVEIICVNDAPTANDDAAVVNEDSTIGISVLTNDTDPDAGDGLSVTLVTDPPNGQAQIGSSGVVTYAPNPNFCGTDTFTYSISDSNGGGDSGDVSLTVNCVNDAPVFSDTADQATPWGEELQVALITTDADAGDGDPATSDTINYSFVTAPTGAAISSDGLGNFVVAWTASQSQVGTHAFTVRASDGSLFDDGTFYVTVGKRGTAITYTGATSVQYSDPAAVSAVLTDFEGTPLESKTLSFTIGTQSTSAATNGSGEAAGSIVVTDAPGSISAEISFAEDAGYLGTGTLHPFVIEKELINLTFAGRHLTTTSGTSAPAILSATLAEEDDGNLGSGIATLQVTFSRISGTPFCSSSVTLTGPGKGNASCTTGSLTLGSRAVIVSVSGAPYGGPVDVGAFAIAQVPAGSAAGAGRTGSDDFAFRAIPVRKSTPSGDAVHAFRQAADIGFGLRDYAFVVKSSSLSLLSRGCSGGKAKVCTAVIEGGSASTWAVDLLTGDVIAQAGTSQIRMDATDVAEPGTGSDKYAVSITGATSYSLGTPLGQITITGGNVRIPT